MEDTEAYRFLWLRSFHDTIAVRLFRRGDVSGLEAVILDHARSTSQATLRVGGKVFEEVIEVGAPVDGERMAGRPEDALGHSGANEISSRCKRSSW